MTIKDIDKQVEATKETRAQLERVQQENEEKAKDCRIKADAAAADGDLTGYKKLKGLAEDAEAVAYVCKKQLEVEAAPAVTKAQTVEAWDEYAADYNKKITEKLEKVRKAKESFLREYMEAVDMQREACSVRERLAFYVGVKPDRVDSVYDMAYIPYHNGMEPGKPSVWLKGAGVDDPDAVALLASLNLSPAQLAQDERQQIVTAVVRYHKSR